MTSRRIPISSTQQQRPAQPSQDNTAFQSSLDLVFSFSRAAGFFGENLPTGPSFVDADRYPRASFDGDHLAGPAGPDSSDRERTDDAEETDDHDHEEAWSGDDLDGGAHSWDGLAAGEGAAREHLPPNAVARGRTAHRVSRGAVAAQEQQAPAPSWRDQPAATERTALLPPIGPTSPSASHISPDGSAVHPSFSDTAIDDEEYLASGVARIRSSGKRRASTFSREAWKAAIEEHRGESTWGQTLFNTVNVLVGVGLLANPLAFADAGWVFGTILLLFCALVTNYTAKMLAAMMRQDRTSATYADVLIKAYGPWARSIIYFLFVVELATFSVATVTLFADSMSSLFPRFSPFFFKLVSYLILLPTTYLPLRILSLTSLLGIMSSVVLLAVLISDGAIKRTAPGSLWEVMPTSVLPRWKRFPISFGLLMSGFSGHAVVPSLYRDMAHPERFSSMINVAYVIAFSVSLVFAVLGYLMFGNGVSSEITRDLAATPGYPVVLNQIAVWMVAINPLVKYAIANKPLVQTFEHLIGLHGAVAPPPAEALPPSSSDSALATGTTFSRSSLPAPARSASPLRAIAAAKRIHLVRYVLLRPLLSALCVAAAIAIPEFDRVLAFLGSASAFVICVIGPVGAYLIVGGRGRARSAKGARTLEDGAPAPPATPASKHPVVAHARALRAAEVERRERERWLAAGAPEPLVVSGAERALCWVLLGVSVVMAGVGTVWSFLPVEEAGIR
ncbi:hypothetical protein JCM10450v2_005365 [Rhodotorula kratochvilovae]